MSHKAPLARVDEEFGGKDKLVDKIVGLLGSGDEPRDELRKRLLGAANSKLIRLHTLATRVKNEHGSHDKLAAATAAALGRSKDKDYVEKIGSLSNSKLLALYEGAVRRNGPPATAGATASARESPRELVDSQVAADAPAAAAKPAPRKRAAAPKAEGETKKARAKAPAAKKK